jgi:hypothetical protein
MRSTDEIHEDIIRVTTARAAADDPARWNADLGRLWREMARAADTEKAPGWTVLAAALLADDYDRRARARDYAPPMVGEEAARAINRALAEDYVDPVDHPDE